MKIAVTGANGFLGSHIVRHLVKSGHNVYALVRKGSQTDHIDKVCKNIIFVDYNKDIEMLRALFKDMDILVHNAGLAKDWGKYDDFQETNVSLVKRVLEVATSCNVPHIVHISSIAVIGEENELRPKNEDSPYRARLNYFLENLFPSGMNHYRITKSLGEQAAIEIARKAQAKLTVLRPAWIFGPREFNAGPYEYCKSVVDGVPVMPGSSKNFFHTVYVEDVARAVDAAIKKAPDGVHVYIIGSKYVQTMQTFYQTFCKYLKKKYPWNIPQFLVFFPTLVLELAYLFFRSSKAPLLTRARLYMLYANNIYDVSKAERELGFSADTDMDYAIRKTVKWWKLNKHL